jgi:tetratricopeptide (TPR) repeat protein
MKKMKKICLIVTIATAVSICCGTLLLHSSGLTTGKGKMSGVVLDLATGKPLAGVTVKLFSAGSNAFHEPSPVTDAEGKWKVAYIRGGRWDLDFVKQGYETSKLSYTVNETPGNAAAPMEVKMKKMEGAAVTQDILKDLEAPNKLMEEQKYDKAMDALAQLYEKYKDDPGVDIISLYIGNCWALKGDFNKAIELYKKALEKFPNNTEIITSIGNAYTNLNDNDNALAWYSKLNIDDIGKVDTLYNMGAITYNKGDFDSAVKYFKKSVEIDPAFADGYYQLGMTYVALSKQKEAVEMLKKFIELAPDSPNVDAAKSVIDAFK